MALGQGRVSAIEKAAKFARVFFKYLASLTVEHGVLGVHFLRLFKMAQCALYLSHDGTVSLTRPFGLVEK
jgi:hypothetical protein